MKKRFLTILTAVLLSVSLAMTSFAAEWKNDEKGWWFSEDDGSYPAAQWKMLNGSWYYFNSDGYMKTGWHQDGDTWYYLDGDGKMLAGEGRTIDGVLYTFDAEGRMLTDAGQAGETAGVTKEQMEQWFYATYAIIANLNEWNANYFKTDRGVWEDDARYRLRIAWGITDKDSADSTVRRLKANGEIDGDAWDYCRAMQVIRESYLAGYYTETEQLDKMLDTAKKIQESFESWDDMTYNYIEGSLGWSGSIDDYTYRGDLYIRLKRTTDYYAIDWNMPLQRCWE